MDIDKVQFIYTATVAAYGRESSRAKEVAAELDGLRAARREAKPLSLQLRAAEGRVKDKRKALDAAKRTAAGFVEAARLAQVAVEEANDKVSACAGRLHEAETEEKRLLQQRPVPEVAPPIAAGAPVGPPAPECVEALRGEIGDDPEGRAALEVIRTRLAARALSFGPVTATRSVSTAGSSNPSGMDEGELFFAGRASRVTRPY